MVSQTKVECVLSLHEFHRRSDIEKTVKKIHSVIEKILAAPYL